MTGARVKFGPAAQKGQAAFDIFEADAARFGVEGGGVEAHAVVLHQHRQVFGAAHELQGHLAGLGVLDDILHQFLNDAEQHILHRRRQPPAAVEAHHFEVDFEAVVGRNLAQEIAHGLGQPAFDEGVGHEVVRNLTYLQKALVHHIQRVLQHRLRPQRVELQLLAQGMQIQLGHRQELPHAVVQIGADAAALGLLGLQHGLRPQLRELLPLLGKLDLTA